MDTKDIIWIAGLLEGEGCFSISKDKQPRIDLRMTDLDIVRKARNILNDKISIYSQQKEGNRKIQHQFTVSGSLAIQWMMTLYPLMGDRRKLKIKDVIKVWSTVLQGKGRCKKGHLIKDANLMKNGPRVMCRICYWNRVRRNVQISA